MPGTPKLILVSVPSAFVEADNLVVSADVGGTRSGRIWFRLGTRSREIAECHNDAFVLPAYLHALHHGCAVHFDFSVSQRLIANLNDSIGPLLVRFAPDLFSAPIRATAKGFLWGPQTGKRPGGSATGMSCGLDSFATARYALDFPLESGRRLSALSHFDVGNHSPLGAPNTELYSARSHRAAEVAYKMGLPLVDIRSNVSEWVPGSFARLHTLRNAAAAYLIYPQVGTYVYANGIRIEDTTLSAFDSAYIDSLLLPLLSTNYLEFIQGTPAWGAPEKTRSVLDDPLAQAYLNVCYFAGKNCGICEKCLRRTLLIDSFGRLDDFAKVFDRSVFKMNRDWYVGYVLMRAKTSPVMRELANHLHDTGYLPGGAARYRWAWNCRRIENRMLRLMGRPRRPL
jgi:hypothetical protein